jgi:hypothetical protein
VCVCVCDVMQAIVTKFFADKRERARLAHYKDWLTNESISPEVSKYLTILYDTIHYHTALYTTLHYTTRHYTTLPHSQSSTHRFHVAALSIAVSLIETTLPLSMCVCVFSFMIL